MRKTRIYAARFPITMIYARYNKHRPSSKCSFPPIFIFTRAHLILAILFTCLQYEAWKFCKIITDHLVVIWTLFGPLRLSNCHLFHQVAHQNDQSKSLVLVRKGRFMRLDQFSCSNHDVGSSAVMASLCIHRKNSKKYNNNLKA